MYIPCYWGILASSRCSQGTEEGNTCVYTSPRVCGCGDIYISTCIYINLNMNIYYFTNSNALLYGTF